MISVVRAAVGRSPTGRCEYGTRPRASTYNTGQWWRRRRWHTRQLSRSITIRRHQTSSSRPAYHLCSY